MGENRKSSRGAGEWLEHEVPSGVFRARWWRIGEFEPVIESGFRAFREGGELGPVEEAMVLPLALAARVVADAEANGIEVRR